MKKIIIISFLFILLPLTSIKAFSITVLDSSFIDRYLGSILLEDNIFQTKTWYLEPTSKKRYPIQSIDNLNLITTQFTHTVNSTILNKIPTTSGQKNIDYNIAKKYSGQFLMTEKNKKEIWYINPLNLLRYNITIDDNGLKTLNDLAVGLSLEKLSIITIASSELSASSENEINFNKYNELRNVLKINYFQPEKISDQKLFNGSLAGLADALDDPYTQFFSPTAKAQFDDNINSSVEGIGAIVDLKNNVFTIVTPLVDSPALKAGLESNDQVLEVDGLSIRNFTLEKSISLIKGQKGTVVTLKIYRQSEEKTFEVKIIRDKITIPNVTAKKLDNNIIYFAINIFSPSLVDDFNKLRSQYVTSSTNGIILDLRNNPGGYTDSAIALADIWLPSDTLILQEKFHSRTENYFTRTAETLTIPTVVLINNSTASAAEIFSTALSESNRAKLVGETSYGKGTGQMIYNFIDGSALKYTYFEWLSGLGKSIENTGIIPDYEVVNDRQTKIDGQLNKAIELLK